VKISGFSFLRDGVKLGYPFEESIRSALPLCDEFVIAVGASDDRTWQRLEQMNEPKLRLLPTQWNEQCRSHGFVYGQQKMSAQYSCTGDWALYLEGDEILHEEDLEALHRAMDYYLEDVAVEALAFDYIHFYGDASHYQGSSQVYRQAPRIIRNSLRSIAPDGLYWAIIKDRTWWGGRNKRRTRYPRAVALNIPIYHYGNARDARFLEAKAAAGNQYWEKDVFFGAYGNIDPLFIRKFEGQHPAVMQSWLQTHANPGLVLNPDYQPTRREKKHRLLAQLERWTGHDFSKKHFKTIRSFHGHD
jgi:glycosyltransferase involved in cell wall biosynthesis